MTEVFIRFPVRCPVCKQEWTSQQTKGEILDALDNSNPIRAYAECHDWHWDLTRPSEMSLRQEYECESGSQCSFTPAPMRLLDTQWQTHTLKLAVVAYRLPFLN